MQFYLNATHPSVLAATPKLAGFYATMIALSAFDGLRERPMYFTRPAEASLYYWPIKARAYASLVAAKLCGFEITEVHDFDLGALKSQLPFGQVCFLLLRFNMFSTHLALSNQLPFLVHGDVKLAQSNAIFRYVVNSLSKIVFYFFEYNGNNFSQKTQSRGMLVGCSDEDCALSEMLTEVMMFFSSCFFFFFIFAFNSGSE